MTMLPTELVLHLAHRFTITLSESDGLEAATPAILTHIETLEADAREAHSAAKALGCTVADLVEKVKAHTEAARILGVSVAGMPNIVTALRQSEAVLADQLKNRHAILNQCLHLLDQPTAGSFDAVPEMLRAKLGNVERDRAILEAITAVLPPSFVEAAGGLRVTAVAQLVGDAVSAQARIGALEARIAPMAATLQAIAEALPSDLRYDADLAETVRTLVRDLDEAHHRIRSTQEQSAQAAEAHLGELQELRAAHDKAEYLSDALHQHLADSKPLCLALARELWTDDEDLLDLLDTHTPDTLAPTLMRSLTNPYRPASPTPSTASVAAKALEGPADLRYYGTYRQSGRIEAIGGDLIRFHPVEGDSVILNATRRDLEVYPLTPDDLAAEVAKAEARKTASTTAPTPKPPDDDIPW